jgi:cell division protein FtsZ
MASPLLEAGAIDGARGILINITGSSSLKLSEVNEASSLIQTSAHEDANIIFGAVLDEKMGEEVKITVIATGFRDQMPERRARMLSVEETPIVSVPVGSVPVVARDTWMREAAQPAPAAPPRFMTEDEEEHAPSESIFFASAAPAVATTVTIAAQPKAESAMEPVLTVAPDRRRDYAGDFPQNPHGASEMMEPGASAASSSTEGQTEPERDLDVPAFLRRLQF